MNKTANFFISMAAGIVITSCNVINNDSDNSKESNAFIGDWDLTIERTSIENIVNFGENGECSFFTANRYNFSNDTIWLMSDTNNLGEQSPDTIVAKYSFDEFRTLTFERICYQNAYKKPVTFPKLICTPRPVFPYGFFCGNDVVTGYINYFEGKWLVLSENDSSDAETSMVVTFEGGDDPQDSAACSFFDANLYKCFSDTILLIHVYNDSTTWWNPYPDTVKANFDFSENFDTLFLECLNNQGFDGNSSFTLSRIHEFIY